MKKVKKAQSGFGKAPKVGEDRSGIPTPKPTYNELDRLKRTTKKDSTEYEQGFREGVGGKSAFSNKPIPDYNRFTGRLEAEKRRDAASKKKNGGKVVKKAQTGASLGVKPISLTKAQGGYTVKKVSGSNKPPKKADKYKSLGGETGKNAGKSDAGTMKPTHGGAKNGKKMKNGGAISYSSAGKSTGFTGEGTYSPSKSNVGRTKKQATFKSGGKMKTCKGGC